MAAVLFRSLATQIVQTTHLFLSFLSPEASLIFATLELNQETSSDPNICELEKSTVATLVLQGCGTTRFNKFVQSGEPVDLEAALCFFEQALRLLPPGQQLYHTSVSNYASALILRFERTPTDSADLDLGIKQLQDWLSAQPQSDPTSRRLVLVTLARVQDLRWKTFGEFMDLESMIESERQILKLWPPGDAERGRSSARLVAALAQRAQKASQDNTTVAKVSTNKVESVEAQILPESVQTSKEREVVEKTVTIPPVETVSVIDTSSSFSTRGNIIDRNPDS
ncbi:hypothetical protein FRB97_004068 [Tulasnella sp. 331]|nr:hypothetical protein FRB97_004068 [Tulasnella sp. 331]